MTYIYGGEKTYLRYSFTENYNSVIAHKREGNKETIRENLKIKATEN